MDSVTLLGLLAATLTTLSFLPQVLKIWRLKTAVGLSLGMFSMFCTGVVCWLAYGLLIGDLPIIVANGITLLLAGTILILAFRYRRRDRRVAETKSSGTV